MPLLPDETYSTLGKIKTKVRRLTASLSTAQLSDDDLNQYINTFVLYDFPEHLRLFNLKTTLTFFTQPYIDKYATVDTPATDPLYNFKNKYITVNQPAYIAGNQALWCQSEDQFYGMYPMTNSIASIGSTGDGTTTTFTGNINTNQPNTVSSGPSGLILRNNVLFSSIDALGNSLALIDFPSSTSNLIGYLGVPGSNADSVNNDGQINYVTGNFTLTFPTAPAAGATINSQTVLVQPSVPQSILFYDTTFTIRPVPDQAYRVVMEAFIRPTELLSDSQQPELAEFWQFIAFGSAIKVFQDRRDVENIQKVMPEFENQMRLINRRTIVQQTNQRTATIYTEQTGSSGVFGGGWFSNGGSF
jgi:hypothetical protein